MASAPGQGLGLEGRRGAQSPPPQRMPTAALSQTEVAVVRPWTSGTSAPSSAFLVPFQMEAAPRKPTPDGTAALTRLASQPIVPSKKAYMEPRVKTHAPRHTIAIVRMPAGRSARRRSMPMTEPITIDITTRRLICASHLFMPSSTTYRSHRHGSGR